jgi:hypothetical protein
VVAHVSTGDRRSGFRGHLGTVEAIVQTIALYSFAGWAYIALNAVVHPVSLGWPLTHFASWPHEDTFGASCFAVSFVSTLTVRMLRATR